VPISENTFVMVRPASTGRTAPPTVTDMLDGVHLLIWMGVK